MLKNKWELAKILDKRREDMKEPIRILYLLGGPMNFGGTEAFIMNYYRNFNKDNIIIDFVYQGNGKGVFDDELILSGSKIFHVASKIKKPLLFSKQIAAIIKENSYKIVHSQMDAMGAWPLFIAKRLGVPVRIAHSHNTSHQTENKIQFLVNDLAKLLLRRVSTHYFACGEEAGKWLFGKKLYYQNKVRVINNAIQIDKYKFSDFKRDKIRKELGITDEIVIGHIGQFRVQKNHSKLMHIFSKLCLKNNNYKLVLVGSGELEKEIKELVKQLNVEDSVIFMGERNDVPDLLNVFDLFLFPSLFEGLSFVAIEAQANGLPCVFSNTISKETIINDNVVSIKLEESDSVWSEKIISALKLGRVADDKNMVRKKYDIKVEAEKLEQKYIELYNGYQ